MELICRSISTWTTAQKKSDRRRSIVMNDCDIFAILNPFLFSHTANEVSRLPFGSECFGSFRNSKTKQTKKKKIICKLQESTRKTK